MSNDRKSEAMNILRTLLDPAPHPTQAEWPVGATVEQLAELCLKAYHDGWEAGREAAAKDCDAHRRMEAEMHTLGNDSQQAQVLHRQAHRIRALTPPEHTNEQHT